MSQTLSKLTPDSTLGRIISVDEDAAQLLASIGLDISTNQDKTLREVCAQKQWSEVEVIQWIHKNHYLKHLEKNQDKPDEKSIDQKNIAEQCDELEDNYHAYFREVLSDLAETFPRVCSVHGQQYPWLKQLHLHFERFRDDLSFYLKFEQAKLFPLIRQLHKQGVYDVKDGLARSLERSIEILYEDHQKLNHQMEKMEKLGRGFELPEGSCSTFHILFTDLEKLIGKLRDYFKVEKKSFVPCVQNKLRSQ